MKKIFLVRNIFLVFMFVYFVFSFFKPGKSNRELTTNNYLKNLNMELTGRVKSKQKFTHNVVELELDVIKSNKIEYDPSDSLRYYLCIINKKKAKLILSDPDSFDINDVVVVSSKRDSIYIYSNKNVLKEKMGMYLVDFEY